MPKYSVAPYQGMESADILFEFAMSTLVEQDCETAYRHETIEAIWVRRSIGRLTITIILRDCKIENAVQHENSLH